jgi:prolyl-tRNA synthetase
MRCHVDEREIAAADKRWQWIKKGVPVLCEVGPRDLQQGTVACGLRHDLDSGRRSLQLEELIGVAPKLLSEVREALWRQAFDYRRLRTTAEIRTFDKLREYFGEQEDDASGGGFVRAKWSGDLMSERKLRELGVTVRCLPLEQGSEPGPCILTGAPARYDAIFARAY